jgi:hypothetical protein
MYLENVQNAIVGSTITTKGGDVLVNGQKVTNIFYSAQYQDLKKQGDKLRERFDKARQKIEKYPDEKDFKVELLQIDEERQEVQKRLDDLKREVISLAETFTKIPINTERLRLARQNFEAGDYPAARAILDAEQMSSELDALLHQKEQLQRQQIDNETHLIDKATEFLILARLTAIDFTLAAWQQHRKRPDPRISFCSPPFSARQSATRGFGRQSRRGLSSSVNSGGFFIEKVVTLGAKLDCINERLCKGKSGSAFPGFPALRKGIALSKPLAIHLCNAHRLRPRLKGRLGNRRAGKCAQGCWLRTHLS